MEKETIRLEIEVSRENVMSCVVSALESSCGIGYWAELRARPRDKTTIATIRESETFPPGPWVDLNDEAIAHGLKLLAEKHGETFGRIIEGTADAIDGDVLIQLAVLGEVRYG